MSVINHKDKSGKTPLIRACISGNVDMVKSLLSHKDIDINLGDNDGDGPLHLSSMMGWHSVTKLLIDKGANINMRENLGNTPLNAACLQHMKMKKQLDEFNDENFHQGIQILLRHGADPNQPSTNGWTPLHNACGYSGSPTLIKCLINRGADMNAKEKIGATPLMIACQNGFATSVKSLIASKVDVNASGERNRTAFWTACLSGRVECAQLLLDAGADIEKPIAYGTSPLNIACEADQPAMVKFLIEQKADLNTMNKHKINATGIASFQGHFECLRLMVDAGADLNLQDKDGHTPLHLAVYNNHPKCAELLVKAGSDLSITDKDKDTVLHLAVYRDHPDCVKLLVDGGADMTAQNKHGHTPLHLGVYKNHPECVKLLIDAGADQSIIDKAGATPLHLATGKNHTVCAQLLLGENPPSLSVKKKPSSKATGTRLGLKGELDKLLEKLLGDTALSDLLANDTDAKTVSEQFAVLRKDSEEERSIHVMDIASAFLKDLQLSDAYFDPNYDVCFCESCHSKRGDKLKYTRGNPPMDYGLPIGWCKFGLRLKPQAEAENIFSDWHVAFHGTRVPNLKKILKNGDLLKPGDVTFDGEELSIPPNHWDPKNPAMVPPPGHDVRKLYFSPSIKYSGCSCYAPKWGWMDPKTKKTHHIRVAFQVRIKPGVYEITPQTIGAKKELDPLFPNKELEWSTNRFGVSMLVGLLVKVEGHTSEEKVDIARTAAKNEPTLPQDSFNESGPVKIKNDYKYKTPRGGHTIQLKAGDDCLLLSKSDKECVIMHPKVDDPISLPIAFLCI